MSFKLFSIFCLVSLLQVVTAAPLSTHPKKHKPGVTHSARLVDSVTTEGHSLTVIILISVLCAIVVGSLILAIVLYFCCCQTSEPGGSGERLSKKGSKPGSKASHALSRGTIQEALVMEENGSGHGDDDSGGEPVDSTGGGHEAVFPVMSHGSVGGSRRVTAASSNKKPLTATSRRQTVGGGAKRKEKKGNKGGGGDGANREKHPKGGRHHNASKQAKQQQKKGHKKKRVAGGKGGGQHPNKPAKAADPQESQLYNEGLTYYKQFLKSVHSVKSVSQYFDGKGGQHKGPAAKAPAPKAPALKAPVHKAPKAKQPTDAQDSQILYDEGVGYYKQFLKSVHSVKSVSQYFDPKQQKRHK